MRDLYKESIALYINQTLRYVWLGSRLPKKKPPFLLLDPGLLTVDSESVTDLYVYGRLNTFVRVNGVKRRDANFSHMLVPAHETGEIYHVEFKFLSGPIRKYIHTAFFLEAQSLEMLRIVELVMARGMSTETFLSVFPALEKHIMEMHAPKLKEKFRAFEPPELLRLQIEQVNTMLTESVLLADTDLSTHGRNWNIF